ncbi:MAG: glycerate kinase [Planctomycetota bacterium]
MTPADTLRVLFDEGLAAVSPARCVPPHLPAPPRGRTVIVGAGKAAAAMAAAATSHFPGATGLVVTRYGHGVDGAGIEVMEAGHPLPDASSEVAARRVLAAVGGLNADDLVLCLLSGGGSALLTLPRRGVSLADQRDLGAQLLRTGATIHEVNLVRSHLSAIKGGRLAAACRPAPVVTLAISDVPGDDVAVIASGPTVGNASRGTEALAILQRDRVTVPAHVRECLLRPSAPLPPAHPEDRAVVIASAADALGAAADAARAHGLEPVVLGDALQGEARQLAARHAALALRMAAEPADRPRVLLSGGETQVAVRGSGRGGRNTEYGLALALRLAGAPGVWALACDTDGIDGSSDHAGCVVMPDTLARAQALGMDPQVHLADNDAHPLFAALDDLVWTGPTRTNVNDFRAILVR